MVGADSEEVEPERDRDDRKKKCSTRETDGGSWRDLKLACFLISVVVEAGAMGSSCSIGGAGRSLSLLLSHVREDDDDDGANEGVVPKDVVAIWLGWRW